MKRTNLPYINREIAWLSFNERVLQEAADPTTPLLERVKFLAIYSNNRDEFIVCVWRQLSEWSRLDGGQFR